MDLGHAVAANALNQFVIAQACAFSFGHEESVLLPMTQPEKL
jgi:hypothetical protein